MHYKVLLHIILLVFSRCDICISYH